MERICNICGGNLKTIVSETDSSYYFCENCGDRKDISLKHALMDHILKNLNNYLKKVDVHILCNIEILVSKEDEIITTKLNDIVIDKFKCSYKFSDKEICHFRNSLTYIIEDNLFIDIDRINLIINL